MFNSLSDEDFQYEEGKREEMLERLRVKLGKSQTELEHIFAQIQLSWTSANKKNPYTDIEWQKLWTGAENRL